MSDNIIRPEQWLLNGAASLSTDSAAVSEDGGPSLGGGSGGPHDPNMDRRVATLEADIKEVKGSLGRIETTLGRVDEAMKHVATKAELTVVTGSLNTLSTKVDGLDARVVNVQSAIKDTIGTALSKSIGPVQAVAMLAGAIAVLVAAGSLVNWLMVHGYFPHSP